MKTIHHVWSPDSKWIAYTLSTKAYIQTVYAYSIEQDKSFAITEKKRVDFRWEAFNLFNRTQFGNPNANLNSSTFGVISSQANTPRQMQAALKLYW